MQKIDRVKLKNGLEIYFLIDKKFTTSSIQMMFKIGWRNDPVEQLGLAHLFEHLVGKRTKKYPDKSEFAKKLEVSGISHNAWTGPDTTVYFQDQTNENLFTSLKLFLEAIYNSTFLEEDMQKEKQVVLTEARRYLDNDQSVIWQKTVQALFPGTTFRKFFFGTKKTLEEITIKVFEDFYQVYRNPTNSILFIGTDNKKNKKRIVSYLEKFYNSKAVKPFLGNKEIERFVDAEKEVVKSSTINKKEKTQSDIRIAFRLKETLNTKERIAFNALKQLLVGGFTGRLVKVLRDEMGLIYSIDMWWDENLQNKQYVCFETECAKESRNKVIEVIKDEINNLENYIQDNDVKKVVPGNMYKAKRPTHISYDLSELINSVIHNYEYVQIEKSLKILKGLKSSDVIKLAKKMFNQENLCVVVME